MDEEQTVMLIYLMNNQILISDITEIEAAEIGMPDCKLVKPFILNQSSLTMEPWVSHVSNDTEIYLSSEKILTLVEPNNELVEKYKQLIK